MKAIRFLVFTLMLFVMSGCAANQKITYPLQDVAPITGSQIIDADLVVKEFEDIRQPLARKGGWSSPAMITRDNASWFYNSDDHYQDNRVAPWITEMIAKHLDTLGIFRGVKVNQAGEAVPDLYLEGKIKQFEAFKKRSMATVVGSQFGLIGLLATSGVKSEYEAATMLTQVRLLRTSTNEVLWEGEVEGRISGKDYADTAGWSVYEKANLSLKKAVDELANRLAKVPQPAKE